MILKKPAVILPVFLCKNYLFSKTAGIIIFNPAGLLQ